MSNRTLQIRKEQGNLAFTSSIAKVKKNVLEDQGYRHYGDFNADGSEFVIHRLDTPKPWLNFCWNPELLSAVDQRGQGHSIYRDSTGARTNLISDRRVYLKDQEHGGQWSLGQHTRSEALSRTVCFHGLGYTRIESVHNDIQCEWTVTCSGDAPVELWRLRLVNKSNRARTISLYPYVEFDLGGFDVYGGLENTTLCRVDQGRNSIQAINQCRSRLGTKNNCAFIGTPGALGYQTSKRAFVGSASIDQPQALHSSSLGTFATANEPMVGVFQYDVQLQPQAQAEYYFAIYPFAQSAEKHCPERPDKESFDRALDDKKYKSECFTRVKIDLQDEYFSPLLDVWSKQQLSMLMDYSRGWTMGFRDTLQDSQAFCSLDPARTRQVVLQAMRHQYDDGRTVRGYWPIDDNAYADGGVWLTFTLAEYVKETGDFDFLNVEEAYFDNGADTVFQHAIKAIDWITESLGEHGLTKMQFGDWNDSLNIGIKGRGESVWLSMAAVLACNQLAELAGRIGEKDTQRKYEHRAAKLTASIEEHCWDGSWYLRGFTDEQQPVGGSECKFGRIFAEPQTWAIIAGIAKDEKDILERAMQKHLMSPYGLTVCSPAFREYDENLGRITTMPPGWGENGSAYCHVSGFKAVADCIRGDGNAALETLRRIVAINPQNPIEVSAVEPYGFTNMYCGPEHPRAGRSLRSWFTGTTGWVFRCVTQYMLGIRPDYDGLIIDPVLPDNWPEAKMRRVFRSAEYNIHIDNRKGVQNPQAWTIIVDGVGLAGNVLPYAIYNGKHQVQAIPKENGASC